MSTTTEPHGSVATNGRTLPPARVIRWTRHEDAHWALMPALMRRVREWCE